MQFIVMCSVSGGVTGTRTGPARRNDAVVVFGTVEAAQAYCAKLNATLRPHACVRYHYWVQEKSEGGE